MTLRRGEQVGVHIEPLEARTLFQASLTVEDVQTLLGQAGSQGRPNQAVVVSDREGVILGIFSIGNATAFTVSKAIARARTAAFFQSAQDAFTTRTARFIIQDHFPPGIPNTPGGPLYGVEFSSLFGTDVLLNGQAPFPPDFIQQAQVPGQLPLNISGDPGGIPLYKNGEPVGGIGVAGDGRDIAPRQNFLDIQSAPGVFPFRIDNPGNKFFNGTEENDFDEAVALAGANGFMAPRVIRATQIFLDGLRLPFTKDQPATGQPNRTLDQLIADGVGTLKKAGVIPPNQPAIQASPTPPWPTTNLFPITGELKNTNPAAQPGFRIISSNDPGPEHLTFKDVNKVISDAVAQALTVRAAIREPIGQPTIVHIAVVDIDGDILGVFRMDDGTNFSFDVAVQKARTAAFFSDNRHAFTARGVGFVSQRFFPPGIDGPGLGPLFMLQDNLSLSGPQNFGEMTPNNPVKNPLRNGITIFPGGAPLYKNGVLVGAVGVSGDGVDQDDIVTFAGTKRFQPSASIRCDVISNADSVQLLRDRVEFIGSHYDLLINTDPDIITDILARLDAGLKGVRLPYVKFPRNPTL